MLKTRLATVAMAAALALAQPWAHTQPAAGAPTAKLNLDTTWQDKVVGSETVPDLTRVASHRVVFTSFRLVQASPSRLEIAAREQLVAAAAKVDIVERTTVRVAPGGSAVGAVLGAINVVNPVAWLLNNSFEGVNPVISTQQKVTPQKTSTKMLFISDPAPSADIATRDFSGPAANQGIRITTETPKFIVELSYTLDSDGKFALPIPELVAELTRYGYVDDGSPVSLHLEATALPSTQGRLELPSKIVQSTGR